MSRMFAVANWLAILPYAYIVYFLGRFVGDSPHTPMAAAVIFWGYLAIYPLMAIVCNAAARGLRRGGREAWASVAGLAPWGVLTAVCFLFPAFVGFLARLCG